MKIRAITVYKDLHENKTVEIGDVYDTTPERARIIVARGFAVYEVEEVKPKKEVKRKK